MAGIRGLTPEGLYGRRKMTALIQRTLPEASPGAVDRAMNSTGVEGGPAVQGRARDDPGRGRPPGRDFAACAPDRTRVMDLAYCRTWVGFAYVSLIVDVFAQRMVAWHAATSEDLGLVMTPLRMAAWQRSCEGHPIEPGQLMGHADAGSPCTPITLTGHLDLEGIRPSTWTVADAYDSVLMETVTGLFKPKCIRTTVFHSGPWPTIADAAWAPFGWVDWWTNRRLRSRSSSARSPTSTDHSPRFRDSCC